MTEDKSEKFAGVSWTIGDLETLRPSWTRPRIRIWWCENERRIQDAMVMAGWEAIETLLEDE